MHVRVQKSKVLHRCLACDETWAAFKEERTCPGCEYEEPKHPKTDLRVIQRLRVRMDPESGRVRAHVKVADNPNLVKVPYSKWLRYRTAIVANEAEDGK